MSATAVRRARAALLASGALAAGLASPAAAATLAPGVPCARYVPALAGERWIPIRGSGFTPNTDPSVNSIRLDWANRDLGGFSPLAADGSFTTRALMPSEFIRRATGRIKTYTVTATDRATPGLRASTRITLVRAGIEYPETGSNRDPRRTVRWSVYGAPTGSSVHVHWVHGGVRRATRAFGRAQGACGLVSQRAPVIPARLRSGTWRVYVTAGRTFSVRRALFGVEVNVFRTFG
jgi:hypothetical protein